ncbi:MAG: hypothetical protein SCG84_04535 [Nitrosomonadaceae bacterium]|nr:hypothetical protein [Nitrosospira sp.]MDW7619133.1 hypothetical protein [Nitrosomonadaceae bacterium]
MHPATDRQSLGRSTILSRKMLESGDRPDEWDQLLLEAQTEDDRLNQIRIGQVYP